MKMRAARWLGDKIPADRVPWWGSLVSLGLRRHLWPLAWHRTDFEDGDVGGEAVWNPVLRCYDFSVRVGRDTFDDRAGRIYEVVAAVERRRGAEDAPPSVFG